MTAAWPLAARLQLPRIHRDQDDDDAIAITQPVGLERVAGGLKRPALWHYQRRRVPRRISFADHGQGT